MTAQAVERMRNKAEPALLSYGFRPFFLGGAVWAAGAMILWVFMLTGLVDLPMRLDAISWHAHEFLFGALIAIVAGFLLTAVPNWTGRPPLTGWRLGALALLWLAGRAVILLSAGLPWSVVVIIDLAFPVILGAFILREIVAGKNWRNLVVLGLLAMFAVANGLFYLDAAQGRFAAQGVGLRLGLGAAIMMIALIGGRIVPAFTKNWLASRGDAARPAGPMQTFDKVALLLTLAAILLWVVWPQSPVSGIGLLVVGVLHILRLARWCGWRTGAEPLLLVLHVGYAFLPLGALALAADVLLPSAIGAGAAQHLWMAGAIGLMTLAVMTRATLGHTGRTLTAGSGTLAIYGMLIASVVLRCFSPLLPDLPLLEAAAVMWVGAFGGFALLYGPLMLRATPGKA